MLGQYSCKEFYSVEDDGKDDLNNDDQEEDAIDVVEVKVDLELDVENQSNN